MKSFRIPCLILVAMLLLSLSSSWWIHRRCQDWTDQIDQIDQCVVQEDWAKAEKKMDTLCQHWRGAQPYLYVVSHHRELDSAEELLWRSQALLQEHDRHALRAHLADLRSQLHYLAEAEACSWRNIL